MTFFILIQTLNPLNVVFCSIGAQTPKPLDSLERILGEKFPVSARLIRIFSRKMQGIELWQNWFNWMPVNSLVVIDECQDIFAPEVGFKREKSLKRPLEDFLEHLPDGHADLFYERWTMADTSNLDEGDTDDTGETQLDDQGRLLYPDNFYGAFMRHRKYQWDVILLTPDYTSIPKWMQGCATDAFSHTSTDTFFRKRRPRIYNHRPKSTKTAPSTKQDLAACTNKKIPVDVFALYQSTGTGGFNESKADITILKSPKFIAVVLVGLLALGNFVREAYALYSSNSDDTTEAVSEEVSASSSSDENGSRVSVDENQGNTKSSVSVASGNGSAQSNFEVVIDSVNPFYRHFPVFNNASSVYLTSVLKMRDHDEFTSFDYRFRIDKQEGSYYISSTVLKRYGYQFEVIDDCLIQVELENTLRMLTCPPIQQVTASSDEALSERADDLEQIDIFKLTDNDKEA